MQMTKYALIVFIFLSHTNLVKAETKEWSFDVYLDNKIIGFHNFKLNNDNQLLSEAKFKVDFLFLTAYEYQHTSKEQWNNNCLTSLEANTKENKSTSKVNAYLNNNNFIVHGNADSYDRYRSLPKCVMTFAYWNPSILTQTKLLNPQNGDFLDVIFRPEPSKTIDFKDEQKNIKIYRLYGNSSESLPKKPKIDILVWYDENNDWLGLKSTTPEGFIISYKRRF